MFIPCHNCFLPKSVSLYCSCIICFLTTHFFTPFAFFIFFYCLSVSSTFSISDRRTLLWKFHCIRLSFFLKRFFWRLNKVDAPSGNRSYHMDFCLFRCLYRRHSFQSQAEGCWCLCTKVRTLGHNFFSARNRKNHTSRSCCCQGLSSLCRQAC